MSCDKNKSFQVANLFNELKTDGEKRIARLNLGVKDSDSLTWGNIGGNIYDLEDLIYFVEMLKMLASLTGTVVIFRLNDNTIDRTTLDIPQGWQDTLPDTTLQDELWMTQAVKQGGIYKVGENGFVWGIPVKINYSNVVDAALQLEIDELRNRLNELIQNQLYLDNLVNSMNLVTVNEDGSISVTGRDGQSSVWLHQDLGNYLMLGNVYGNALDNSTSYFLINKTGLLQAHNAVVHGTIYATDGWFAGLLRAATGSFTGEITATSGRIGGWQIVDGVLKPENVPTTALIGKILASQVEFGSTLTDLRTLIADDYNNKINTLRNSILSNIDLISTQFLLSNDSIQSSVLEIRTLQDTQNLNIRTILNGLNTEKNARLVLYQILESKILESANLLSLGVQESLVTYLDNFKNYVTKSQLTSELTLLSNLIAAKVSQTEYDTNNSLILDKFAELSITPEQIQSVVTDKVTEATSNWTLTTDTLQAQITEKGNLLSQLGITSEGIIMKGNTLAYYSTDDDTNPVFACNADGSGNISKGAISWDLNGIATFDQNVHIGNWRLGLTEFYTGDLYNNATFPPRSLNPETYYSLLLDKYGIQLFSYKQNINEVTGSMFMIEQTSMFSRTIHSVNTYNPGSSISWIGSKKIFNIDFSTGYATFCNENITLEDDKITLTNELQDKLIISADELTFYNSIEDTELTISWEELFDKLNSIN